MEHTNGDLKKKAVFGGLYQVNGRFLLRFVKIVRTIIIARFLFPEDVGLFVLASSLLGVTELFLQTGFQSAIVHRAEVLRKHLDGVWTLNLVKNLFLGSVVYSSAPWCADFFGNEALTDVLQVLSLIYFIESFVNIGTVLIQKEMRFGRQLAYDSSYVLTEVVATIVCAYFLRDVWALVYGAILGRLASVVFSYVFHEYRPRVTFDFSGAGELFIFSKWVWFTSICVFVSGKIDIFSISKFLTLDDLGHYQLALSLALLPAVEISRSLATVLFPLFSSLQTTADRLHNAFLHAVHIIAAVTVPMSAGIFILSHEIISVLYGDVWIQSAPLLKIFALYGILKSFEYVFTSFFNSVGAPKVVMVGSVMQTVILIMSIVPLILHFGIVGAPIALVCASFINTIYFMYSMKHYGFKHTTRLFGYCLVPILASLSMGIFLTVLLSQEIHISILYLCVHVMVGLCVYGVAFLLIDRLFGKHYYHLIDMITSGKLEKIREKIRLQFF